MIRAYHLYTGSDGHSHVVKGRMVENVVIEVESVSFKETPAHSSYDWHPAPTTQYVITLAGALEFVTFGGEVFTLEPGDVLIAMDTTGSGHKWRLVNDQPWRRAYVVFKNDPSVNFQPDT